MRIVLAHSGGRVTSVAIPWLKRQYGAEIVTVTLDLGQGVDLASVREHALASGAIRAHIIDAREELVRDFVQPALEAGVFGDLDGALIHAISLPLIVRRTVDLARMESAVAVAHGGQPGTPPEVSLHASFRALDPDLQVLAPASEWSMSPSDVIAVATASGVAAPRLAGAGGGANVWGRTASAAGGTTGGAFVLTRSPADAPSTPAYVEIEFSDGLAVRANGVEMQPLELIESLETIAGAHGVGRRVQGSTAVEAPAPLVLHAARQALEQAALGEDLVALKQKLAGVYAGLILSGRWFSDVRDSVDQFVRLLQPRVTGSVRVRLLAGACEIVDVRTAFDTRRGPERHPKAVA